MRRAEPKDGEEDTATDDSRGDDDLTAWNIDRLVAFASMMEAEAMLPEPRKMQDVDVEYGVCTEYGGGRSTGMVSTYIP
jgi:hypothetical protein